MKGKSYYALLISLIIIGIGSFNFYQQKQEERLLEFEGYEISIIEDRVEALYNDEKTDIVEDISEDELEELDQLFLDLKEKDLHKENRRRITDMELDFLMAREMNTIQEDIRALFDKKIVVSSAELRDIGRLKREIEAYSIRPVYYERNIELLEDGKQQLTAIQEAEELVESLIDEEGNLLEGVTQDDIDEALEMIEQIKNAEIRNTLAASLDGQVIPVEEEVEEEENEEVEIEEVEETPEQEEPESTPSRPTRRPTSNRPNPGNNNNSGSSGGTTGNGSGSSSDSNPGGGNNNDGDDTKNEPETPVTPVTPSPGPDQPVKPDPKPPVVPEPEEPEQPIKPEDPAPEEPKPPVEPDPDN